MDKETIQQIAAQVVAQLPLGLLTILNLFIVALVSALTALGVSYFRTRGQNLATKHDFEELLRQLKINTESVETIKSEVSQRDWAEREWTNLRRVKLEALLEKMHECDVYLERRRHSAMDGEVAKPERSPVDELDVLAALFPELKNEADRFSFICSRQMALFSMHGLDIVKSRDDLTARQVAYDAFQRKFESEYGEFLVARKALRAAARSLLERIMNVDEGDAPRPIHGYSSTPNGK
jgi:hypothetical protein